MHNCVSSEISASRAGLEIRATRCDERRAKTEGQRFETGLLRYGLRLRCSKLIAFLALKFE